MRFNIAYILLYSEQGIKRFNKAIVMLTTQGDVMDPIVSLAIGADDCLSC